MSQDFKDANIIHLCKNKSDRSSCGNHRGISLRATAGKVFAKIIADRLAKKVSEKILLESLCGFRPGRRTVVMIFLTRQIQGKCREQNREKWAP